jgi:hypothetical protein
MKTVSIHTSIHRWVVIIFIGISCFVDDIAYAKPSLHKAVPRDPFIVIQSGPTVRIPGIGTPTVIRIFNATGPVRWEFNNEVVGEGITHDVIAAGVYYASVMIRLGGQEIWTTVSSIRILPVSHNLTLEGPNPLNPSVHTGYCVTSNGQSYIDRVLWYRNNVYLPENNTRCMAIVMPAHYHAFVTYRFESDNVTFRIEGETIQPALQAPIVSIDKTIYDPVSSPPSISVSYATSYSAIRYYRNATVIQGAGGYGHQVSNTGTYWVLGILPNGTYAYANEIIIDKGSIPEPIIGADGDYLKYEDPEIHLSVQQNYNVGYTWFFNNQPIEGSNTQGITIHTPGTYKVTACARFPDGTRECKTAEKVITGEVLFVNYSRTQAPLVEGVTTRQQLDALPAHELRTATLYYDGFIRPIQEVAKGYSPNGKDMASFISYDQFDRLHKKFLPFERNTNDGLYRYLSATHHNNHQAFFQNPNDDIADTQYPYSELVYEASPLNKVIEQSFPGEDWKVGEHSIRTHEDLNTGMHSVKLWKPEGNTLVSMTYLPARLKISRVMDENGHSRYAYFDKYGNKVMDETEQQGMLKHRTYYVYNDLNKLIYIIPPQTAANHHQSPIIDAETIQRECYRYRYDERGRVIEKGTPGASAVYILYDPWDRVVLTQNGNQRVRHQWTFYKYDAMDRTVMTGEMLFDQTPATLNQSIKDFYAHVSQTPSIRYEDRLTPGIHGYSNRSFPVLANGMQVYGVTYFDDYNFSSSRYAFRAEPALGLNEYFNRVQGMVTGSKTLILGTNEYIQTVQYYDTQYRPIQTISDNGIGGIDRTSKQYNFTNALVKEKTIHQGTEQIVIEKTYTYDHTGRLLTLHHQINDGAPVLISDHHYNALGELAEKNIHKNGNQFLQSLDYRYNTRGWMTSMNGENTPEPNASYNDFYQYQLYYSENAAITSVNQIPQYNGNISAFKETRPFYVNQGIPYQSLYSYEYDQRDQLIQASYYQLSDRSKDGWYDVSGISYDLNGNLITLKRHGVVDHVPQMLDNLQYHYIGNQLRGVSDSANKVAGFVKP